MVLRLFQAWYWLDPLASFPNRWAAAYDLRRPESERNDILQEGLFRASICCSHPDYCRKVKEVYGTIDSLRSCRAFKSTAQSHGLHGLTTSMGLERLLSTVKKATPARLPFAERVLAAGLLTQWIKPHMSANGLKDIKL